MAFGTDALSFENSKSLLVTMTLLLMCYFSILVATCSICVLCLTPFLYIVCTFSQQLHVGAWFVEGSLCAHLLLARPSTQGQILLIRSGTETERLRMYAPDGLSQSNICTQVGNLWHTSIVGTFNSMLFMQPLFLCHDCSWPSPCSSKDGSMPCSTAHAQLQLRPQLQLQSQRSIVAQCGAVQHNGVVWHGLMQLM